MTRLTILPLVAVIASAAITPVHAHEIPPQVRDVSASIMMLCTRVEMHGLFRSMNVDGEYAVQHESENIETCSNAFQISENRVLSAAHVKSDVETILTQHFTNKLTVLDTHGFTPGYSPENIDTVTLARFLVSSDGHRFYEPQEKYQASWKGELAAETVQDFLASLVPQNAGSDGTASKARVLATDAKRDLMLLSISPSHEQKVYVSMTPGDDTMGTNAWGVAALLPWNGKGELNLVIGGGIVQQPILGSIPREGIVIDMSQPTKGGYSGGFVVDDEGRLIGVTQASTALEHSWSFDLPHPCSSALPCKRTVISTDVVHEFMKMHGQ